MKIFFTPEAAQQADDWVVDTVMSKQPKMCGACHEAEMKTGSLLGVCDGDAVSRLRKDEDDLALRSDGLSVSA